MREGLTFHPVRTMDEVLTIGVGRTRSSQPFAGDAPTAAALAQ